MDKNILNILFNYKGTINFHQFRVGSFIIFVCISLSLLLTSTQSVLQLLSARIGSEYLLIGSQLSMILSGLIPTLVPLSFITTYSAFVLGLKRMRSLSQNKGLGILSGVVNYLFFSSFLPLITAVTLFSSMVFPSNYNDNIDTSPLKISILIISGLLLIGLVNFIYLWIIRDEEVDCEESPEGKLSPSNYTLSIGRLMGISVLFTLVLGIVAYFTYPYEVLEHLVTKIILIAIVVLFLFFQIKYAIFRLRDAGLSSLWLVTVLIVYVVATGIILWLGFGFGNSSLTHILKFFYTLILNFIVFGQFLLFILSTKKDEEQTPQSSES